jgi:hypothetical protein
MGMAKPNGEAEASLARTAPPATGRGGVGAFAESDLFLYYPGTPEDRDRASKRGLLRSRPQLRQTHRESS